MNRREFIKTALGTAALGATGRLGAADERGTPEAGPPSAADVLKGFVVADAHLGWNVPQQPSLGAQAEAMRTIMKRFPDLDVFLDAGDSMHAGATDADRANWMRTLQRGAGTVPFFLCPGNHDLLGWPAPDSETLCCELGSMPCRPYYSFDIKGIHFVALPELMFCGLVTDEALRWLELDLAVNKDRTTIIWTHNSVGGTTLPQDNIGYRRLAASREMRAFLRRHSNVIAWLHGHNHTWEMIEKGGKLFVSCGRIGGFDPPYPGRFGKGNLGGIYFEVGPGYVTAKGYSATQDKFFDEMEGYQHLTQTMKPKTSLDPNAPNAFSYGVGGARDGERIPVYSHTFLNGGRQELLISGVDSPVLNENPDTSIYTQMTHSANQAKVLPGYEIGGADVNAVGEDFGWDWLHPGVVLYPVEGKPARSISMPEKGNWRRGYYQVVPGRTYTLTVEFETAQPGPVVQVTATVRDRSGTEAASIKGPEWRLAGGRQSFQAQFAVPDLKLIDCIYTNPSSDNRFNITFDIGIDGVTQDVIFRGARLAIAGTTEGTRSPALTFAGTRLAVKGDLAENAVARFDLPQGAARRSVVEVEAAGSGRLTWLVRQSGPLWMARNACVVDMGSHLEIDGLRNKWTPDEEVVVTPLARAPEPYFHKTRHVTKARVRPWANAAMSVEILGSTGPAEIEIRSHAEPKRVTGADSWAYSDRTVHIKKSGRGVIEIGF